MGYSIWLDFSDASERRLQKRIRDTSRKHASPEFRPHLTLVGDIDRELEEVRCLARPFTDVTLPFDVTVRDVRISQKYFMALYLLVDIPVELQALRKLTAAAVNPESYDLDAPHISLAYGNLDQRRLAGDQILLKREFMEQKLHVRGISIVRSSKTVPIEFWERVGSIAFS